MLKSRLLPAFVALALALSAPALAGQQSPAEAEAESMVAAITGAAGKLGRQANIPAVLSETDEQLYRAAFEAVDHGQWSTADRMAERLRDKILLGHLQAQRYLSDAYHPQLAELKEWMAHYADLPEAEDIYGLAIQRLGAKPAALRPPAHPDQAAAASRDEMTQDDFSVESSRVASSDRRGLREAKERFRAQVRAGKTDAAIASLDGGELRRVFDKVDYDEMKTVLAQALFSDGRDADALHWAEEAAEQSGDVLPEAHWVAGLALWRGGHHAESARHFEAVANAREATPWLSGAGAFWAARANLAGHRPEVVNHWLQQAAAYPRTFYGLLARRSLGEDVQYSWEARPFTDLDAETLGHVPAARRALALMQAGEKGIAEEELRRLSQSAGPALSQSMLALAYAGDMPGVAVSLGGQVAAQDGRLHDSAFYPVPDWKPSSGGWSVDRALMLAIARQESALNPKAKSPAGAVGLMQLMPRTAKSMGSAGKLTDPQVSLELGQRYVRHLLEDDSIKGNLIFFAASYNCGEGNLTRWLQTVHHDGDALLFMESIPMRETRVFVQRVMTNFWAYRNRLSQDSPSLDAIAAGEWPMYDGAESKLQAIKHAKN